jgi:hypothetical protein
MVKGSEEIKQALKDRLDEIRRDRKAEWEAFAADAGRFPVPTDSEERLQQLYSIHLAMKHQDEFDEEEYQKESARKGDLPGEGPNACTSCADEGLECEVDAEKNN